MATFEELTGLPLNAEEPVQRPIQTIHRSGADTRRSEGERMDAIRQETSVGDTFRAAWQRNITPMFIDSVERRWSNPAEEGFDPTQWVEENAESLVGTNIEAFRNTRSVAEAEALRDDQHRARANDDAIASRGYTGVAASLLTGMVDPAEIAIGVGTGGYGKGVTMGARVAQAATSGLIGGAASGVAANSVDPLASTQQVVFATLTGALLSGGASVAGFNGSSSALRRSYAGDVRDLPDASLTPTDTPAYDWTAATPDPNRRGPMVFDDEPETFMNADMGGMDDFIAEGMVNNPGSLGAGARTAPRSGLDGMSPTSRAIYDQSMATIRDNDLGRRIEDTDFDTSTPLGRAARRFSNVLATSEYSPFRGDFDTLMNGGSRIEAALGYNLLESAEGRIRNNRSGAMLRETYEQRLSSHSLPQLDDSFNEWADSIQLGVVARHRPNARQMFDREVISELEARFHEGAPVSTNPAIRSAADAVDRNYAAAVEVGRGRDGETAVSGFEEMQPQSGFFNHRWSGTGIRAAMARGVSMERIEALLEAGYARTYPDMDPAYRTMVSRSVVRRAMAREDGVDTNMLNTLDADAQNYLREMLLDGGYREDQIDSLIESIRGRSAERSQLGTTKRRVQVDLRTADGDLSLMDLVDTNLTRVLSRYNREVAGNAALARKGIANRAQRKEIIEAALAERRARDLPAGAEQRKFLEDVFTYFDSGPIGEPINPLVSRAKRITNLALLNQMGLTQAGEAGAQIAAVGMSTWQRHARSVFRQMREQGPDGPILNELRPWMGNVGQEHLLFRDDLMLDELAGTADLNSFLGRLDFALGKGQRLQGYASGFYHVRSFQQRVAVMSMADKAMQRLRDGADEAALTDIGVPQSLRRYIDDGTVEFTPDGYLDRLNMDRWDAADAEDFALAMNRHTHQVVQRAMAGEEGMWMHRTVGSTYMHLKAFPMLAMRKQSARLSGVQTPLAVATLMMGLATAGLAYEAKQLINGRTENISGEDALRGAMGMSNMTGWIPMLTDPAAAMLGMNDLRFNQYGRHSIDTGILSVPPVLPTLNRMAHMPGAVNPWSDLSQNERIRILQSTPIVGNLYGFSALFNSMKN